jgi:hypothetical protein
MGSPTRDYHPDNVNDTPIRSHHSELPDGQMDENAAESSEARSGRVDGGVTSSDKGSEENKRREGEKKERERKSIAKKPREQYSCVECFR